MNKEKYVFAQLTSFLNENKFRHIDDKYQSNQYVKYFKIRESTACSDVLRTLFGFKSM